MRTTFKIILIVWIQCVVISDALSQSVSGNGKLLPYPDNRKGNVTGNYFGTMVADPYRWMENDTSAYLQQWITAQNNLTNDYLDAIPYRNEMRKYLSDTWNYAKETQPIRIGKSYFFTRNDGVQNQAVWYIRQGPDGKEEPLMDPNKLSADGTTAATMLAASRNGRYLAYAVAGAGSDWNTIRIMNLDTRQPLEDELHWVKFPRAAWKGNGFYYSRYPAVEKGKALSGANALNQVYYHRIGDKQEQDSLVFEDHTNPKLSVAAHVTADERFLILSVLPGSFLGFKLTTSTGNALFCQDLSVPGSKIKPLVKGYDHHNIIVDNTDDKLLLQTDLNAPNDRVVLIDPANPEPHNWRPFIAEQEESLENIDTGGDYLWAFYLKDASTMVKQYDYTGCLVRTVALPALGSASNFSAGCGDKELFYLFTNFTTPITVYRLNIASGKSEVYRRPAFKTTATNYVTRQVFVTSKDGTRVPMFIVHKAGIKLDGNNPVFMQGHGGFKRNLIPFFSVARMMFLERGGVYAQPNLRGGNEYGEAWHRGGMRENKQHVFDDFIASTQYLISEGYTTPRRIAVTGVSTGAIMVAACANQRPDLFKVIVPVAGAMDMLRYHQFTIGATWAEEYGISDYKEQFEWLIKYSPLHNVKPGIHYPATIILTGDHDDTVVPAHSFKFAATLQEKQAGDNPVLIRIDRNSGHGPGKPTTKMIEEAADVWSFVFRQLNLEWSR
ncbi:MAG TPA: prolyl oligopeptidase family serine peptidase [Chitinophaga sp.]|uniref:prolyl oligopeptidase family serine peptidase n=1 Tax=Chitinophaga sp. TaxID=1869181 RepID=UPI002CC7660F|nr:prolyl oligopeptidase family serine peptidase [Chitinophaga sp.]HVI46120.1 prolyl oligopeptidase family serine peptidase [Chitinophaga sp.]